MGPELFRMLGRNNGGASLGRFHARPLSPHLDFGHGSEVHLDTESLPHCAARCGASGDNCGQLLGAWALLQPEMNQTSNQLAL